MIVPEELTKLKRVINDYLNGEAYIPDLLVAYKNFKKKIKNKGPVVVLGLVKGAVHAMGKTVVKIFLEANDFRVIDLGPCAEPENFAAAASKYKARAVGISVPVTTSEHFLRTTIRLVREKAPGCRIVIGGCAINNEWVKHVGADSYASDAQGALELFKRVVK